MTTSIVFHRSVDLVNSVTKRIAGSQLIKKKDRILLSLSGGQDSICLLFILNQLSDQMELHLAFFWCHHLWQIDSFFLMKQIAKLSFLFQFDSCFAIPSYFIPSELLARNWRYNCNSRVSLFYKYSKIGIAHTANDKVETVFLNLMRGTGLTGLSPLRWTQVLSKKPLNKNTQDHVSQLSTFFISSFFWWFSKSKRHPFYTSSPTCGYFINQDLFFPTEALASSPKKASKGSKADEDPLFLSTSTEGTISPTVASVVKQDALGSGAKVAAFREQKDSSHKSGVIVPSVEVDRLLFSTEALACFLRFQRLAKLAGGDTVLLTKASCFAPLPKASCFTVEAAEGRTTCFLFHTTFVLLSVKVALAPCCPKEASPQASCFTVVPFASCFTLPLLAKQPKEESQDAAFCFTSEGRTAGRIADCWVVCNITSRELMISNISKKSYHGVDRNQVVIFFCCKPKDNEIIQKLLSVFAKQLWFLVFSDLYVTNNFSLLLKRIVLRKFSLHKTIREKKKNEILQKKKIKAKKWFDLVSYTFLKICSCSTTNSVNKQ